MVDYESNPNNEYVVKLNYEGKVNFSRPLLDKKISYRIAEVKNWLRELPPEYRTLEMFDEYSPQYYDFVEKMDREFIKAKVLHEFPSYEIRTQKEMLEKLENIKLRVDLLPANDPAVVQVCKESGKDFLFISESNYKDGEERSKRKQLVKDLSEEIDSFANCEQPYLKKGILSAKQLNMLLPKLCKLQDKITKLKERPDLFTMPRPEFKKKYLSIKNEFENVKENYDSYDYYRNPFCR